MKTHTSLFIILTMFFVCQKSFADNYFTMLSKDGQRKQVTINQDYSKTTIINPFTEKEPIYGLSISGSLSKKSDNYIVRVILKATDGHEYCVMESYALVNNEASLDFSDYCEETTLLDGIVPESLKLIIVDASFSLENISYITSSTGKQQSKTYEDDKRMIKKAQEKAIVDKINEYNKNHNKIWIAGSTRLSAMNYEDRMRVLGCPENVSTGGYEYYHDGFFQVGDFSNSNSTTRYNSPYVSSFDWRNRHGKNWVTPVKDQGNSNYCFAFSSVACLESMYMLYYNDTTTIDLSEQEAACCTQPTIDTTFSKGGYVIDVLNYMVNHGICDELAYPLDITGYQPCQTDMISFNENVTISGYNRHDSRSNEDSIKHNIINNGPLVSGYWWTKQPWSLKKEYGHSMLMVGYDTIKYQDIIRVHHQLGLGPLDTISDTENELIGKTFWIFKNSYGPYKNDSILGGFRHVIFAENNLTTNNFFMNPYFHITCPINSTLKTDYDRIIEDSDGDGYYFWGIGPKPSHCPSWVPNEPDGDDSDYDYGPMDAYGHLLNLHGLISQSVIITGNTTYSQPQYNYGLTVLVPNSTLTVTSQFTLYDGVYIIVPNGSTLIVDGGSINNADIRLQNGGKLIIRNGGTVTMAEGKEFFAPIGAIVEISEGFIN